MKKALLLALMLVVISVLPAYAQQDDFSVVKSVQSAHAVRQNALSTNPDIVWSPDGARLALIDAKDNKLYIVDAQTGRDVASLDTPDIAALAFNHDGSLLAVATGNGVSYVFNSDALVQFGPITGQNAFSALQNNVFRNFLQSNTGSNQWVSLTFSGDSSFILGTTLAKIVAWDVREAGDFGPMLKSGKGGDAPFNAELTVNDKPAFWPNQLYPYKDGIRGLVFDGRNRSMKFSTVTLNADFKKGTVQITDSTDTQLEVAGGVINVAAAYLSADTSTILVATQDEMLRVDSNGKQLTIPYPDGSLKGFAMQINPDGRLLVGRWQDGTVAILDLDTDDQVYSGQAIQQRLSNRLLNSIYYSPDNTKVLFIGDSGVEIWHLDGKLAAPREIVSSAASGDVICSVDLTDTITLLQQAQETTDVDEFVKLMTQARQQLEGYEAECSS
ncbi:MAG: WD40 repeat domain-containing protein [Anaerolineae bacterium]